MNAAYKEYLTHAKAQLEISLKALYETTSADIIFVATIDTPNASATTLCMLQDGKLVKNITYQLAGSPCENVFGKGARVISGDVSVSYPEDLHLRELQIKSYIGEPIRSSENSDVICILAALFKTEIADSVLVSTLFDAFSARIASDIHYEELNLIHQGTLAELSHKHQLMGEIEVISKTGGWEYDVFNKTTIWTDETFRIHGLNQQKAPSLNKAISYYSEDSRVILETAFALACEKGTPYYLELTLIDAQGTKKWVKTNSKIRRNDDGEITHVYGAIEDISEKKYLQEEQIEHAEFVESTLNCLSDAVVVTDIDGNILLINSATENILEYSAQQITGKNIGLLIPQLSATKQNKYLANYIETTNVTVNGIDREFSARKKSGEIIPIELSLLESNHNGRKVFISVIHDISERKEAQKALNELAYFDPITRLHNSYSFERDFRKLLLRAKLETGLLYAAIIDVDRFSEINLAYGLRSGDAVLQELATRIKQQLSVDFELYRAQDDGFILMCNSPIAKTNLANGEEILHQELAIKKAVQVDLNVQNNQHNITVSIGSLIIESDSATYETVLSLLEFSRKEVKSKGNNARVLLTEIDYQLFERQKTLRRSIPSSMKDEEFFVVLQPKFDVKNNVIASELLLRWNHPVMGSVSPSEFIAVAEQTNDIVELSRWVFKQACRLIASAKALGCETKIAVNISGKDLIRPDFSTILLETIDKYQVQPSSFILEITETILVSDITLVASKLELLTNLGFQFSIDDFGTGYSSLAYLRSLKIHELKIDMLFVREINEKANSPIIDSIIQMAKSLGLVTVAEGVETQLQLDYLKRQMCDLFQGYLLSKPLSEKNWLELLQLQHNSAIWSEST